MEPDAVEIRVLGCLVEKQRTTPDVYPLTLNALRLACNQSTNRDPVVQYDDGHIRAAIDRLVQRKWTTLASWANRRTMKYRHTLDRALGLSEGEIALLAVLMLRGPQTLGELGARSGRMHGFAGSAEVEATLAALGSRGLVRSLGKRPGQREGRYEQLLGGNEADEGVGAAAAPSTPVAQAAPRDAGDEAPAVQAAPPTAPSASAAPAASPAGGNEAPAALEARLGRLEREVAELRAAIDALRAELGA